MELDYIEKDPTPKSYISCRKERYTMAHNEIDAIASMESNESMKPDQRLFTQVILKVAKMLEEDDSPELAEILRACVEFYIKELSPEQ